MPSIDREPYLPGANLTEWQPTHPLLALGARGLRKVVEAGEEAKPNTGFGWLAKLLAMGMDPVQKTMERKAYNEPLTEQFGPRMRLPKADTTETALMVPRGFAAMLGLGGGNTAAHAAGAWGNRKAANVPFDKFYTEPKVAEGFADWTKERVPASIKEWVEPAAGEGVIGRHFPEARMFDIAPEGRNIEQADFLQTLLGFNPDRAFVGNVPYGHRGQTAKAFLQKALSEGEYASFIMPKTASRPHWQAGIQGELIDEAGIPNNAFRAAGQPYNVPSVAQLWKRGEPRPFPAPVQDPRFITQQTRVGGVNTLKGWDEVQPQDVAVRIVRGNTGQIVPASSVPLDARRGYQVLRLTPDERARLEATQWPSMGMSGTLSRQDLLAALEGRDLFQPARLLSFRNESIYPEASLLADTNLRPINQQPADAVSVAKLLKQIKDEPQELPWVSAARALTTPAPAGGRLALHYGDGGIAEPAHRMTQGRGTGHFGTGTYFVGTRPEKLYGSYAGRPEMQLDLADLNLFRPRDADEAHKLHGALRDVNDLAKSSQPLTGDEWNHPLRDPSFKLKLLLGFRNEAQIDQLLREVIEAERRGLSPSEIRSASTRFMQGMGYDGVDVRHTPLDNFEYGSVLYPRRAKP